MTSKLCNYLHSIYSRALNYEELIQNLKEQLDEFDFIEEYERAMEEAEAYEEYYLEDQDGGGEGTPNLNHNGGIGMGYHSQKSSPEFNVNLKAARNDNRNSAGGLFFSRKAQGHNIHRFGSEGTGTGTLGNYMSIQEQ
jgi:hypothetical protein